jgi:hypothetical protein
MCPPVALGILLAASVPGGLGVVLGAVNEALSDRAAKVAARRREPEVQVRKDVWGRAFEPFWAAHPIDLTRQEMPAPDKKGEETRGSRGARRAHATEEDAP